MQRNYWVVRLGRENAYAEPCHKQGLVGIGWLEDIDLAPYLGLEREEFLKKVEEHLREYLKAEEEITDKYVSGTARQIYKFAVAIKPGDVVISPADSKGLKYFGIVKSGYYHKSEPSEIPPHRRDVEWVTAIDKGSFSEDLRNSTGAIMTMFSVSPHAEEIDALLGGGQVVPTGEAIQGGINVKEFGLEAELESFLVHNWDSLDLSKDWEILKEDDEVVGQQYAIDTGRIDILCKGKNANEWLVIELKRGRSSDAVVGQVLSYMGYVKKHMATASEKVSGLIIAREDDKRLQYAISGVDDVDFMTYSVQFQLNQSKQT